MKEIQLVVIDKVPEAKEFISFNRKFYIVKFPRDKTTTKADLIKALMFQRDELTRCYSALEESLDNNKPRE